MYKINTTLRSKGMLALMEGMLLFKPGKPGSSPHAAHSTYLTMLWPTPLIWPYFDWPKNWENADKSPKNRLKHKEIAIKCEKILKYWDMEVSLWKFCWHPLKISGIYQQYILIFSTLNTTSIVSKKDSDHFPTLKKW